ncbi:MAG: hypothetical protein WCO44_04005 [Bacteroidota bacterium]
MQAIIGFTAILAQVTATQNIDFLELNTAKAIESFQDTAVKKDYLITLKTSLQDSSELRIDKTTRYYRTSNVWADAEFYFYGKITDAGGKEKVNIHLMTDEFGIIRIDTPQETLEQLEENILYKSYGIRALGKQNTESGEIDKGSLRFVEMIDYSPAYDTDYLQKLRSKAMTWLNTINPDEWLRDIRGGYNA